MAKKIGLKQLFKIADKHYSAFICKLYEVKAFKNRLNTFNFCEWRVGLIQYETLLTELNHLKDNWEEARVDLLGKRYDILERKIGRLTTKMFCEHEFEYDPLKMYDKLLEKARKLAAKINKIDPFYFEYNDPFKFCK